MNINTTLHRWITMKLNRWTKDYIIASIAIVLVVLTSGTAAAQADLPDLLYPVHDPADTRTGRSVMHNLDDNPTITSIKYVGIRPQLLRDGVKQLRITLPSGQAVAVSLTNKYALDKKSTTWNGLINVKENKAKKATGLENNVRFVVTGDRVTGQINYKGQVYELLTVEEGGHYLLIKRDFSQLPQEDDTPLLDNPINAEELLDNDSKEPRADQAKTIVRVLQIASRNARDQLGGIKSARDRMRLFLNQANEVYRNNGIPLQLQNAGLYTPPGRLGTLDPEILIDRLSNLHDNLLYDNIAGRERNKRRADIVSLMTSRSTVACGIAKAIGARENEAFILVDHSCTDYTFVHEIGHLFGARHDNDRNVTPFRFGHGYVSEIGYFRTVMAISINNPQPRIGLFSNDNQHYPVFFGSVVAGHPGYFDNDRVHRTRRIAVSRFR